MKTSAPSDWREQIEHDREEREKMRERLLRYKTALVKIARAGGASPGDKKHLWAQEALDGNE